MPAYSKTNNDYSGCISLVYFCLPAGYFKQFLGNQTANQRRQRRIPSAADSLSSFSFPQAPCPPISLTSVFPVALFPTSPFSSAFSLCFIMNLLSCRLITKSIGQDGNTFYPDFANKNQPLNKIL